MKSLVAVFRHPASLAGGLLLGAAVGLTLPQGATILTPVGRIYIAMLNMAATPLIVVAVFFGLKRMLSLPRAVVRLAALSILGLAALVVAGLLSAGLAEISGAGRGLSEHAKMVLGRMSLNAESYATFSLFQDASTQASTSGWHQLVPENYYLALAFGSLPAILVGTLCFGFALAVQGGEAARSFHRLMEAIYRSFEVLIEHLNSLLPLMAFALAASVANSAGLDAIQLMRGFLGPFLLTGALLVITCATFASRHLGLSVARVLRDLRRPFVVGLFSGGTAAAVPGFIEAMCNQLGFRRDIVEFTAPVVPVFFRLGDAVFLAVLAVFTANVYGRSPNTESLILIGVLAATGALATVTVAGGRSLAAGVLMLGWLDLPADALLPVFLLLEALCEGVRTVLALALTCALVALASSGLPSEMPKPIATAHFRVPDDGRLRIVLGRRSAYAIGALVALALGAVCLAGIGMGLRRAASPSPTLVSRYL